MASKDYIFDMDKFTSFEGDTGPYILYTIVRIKSILNKVSKEGFDVESAAFSGCHSEAEKTLMLDIAGFHFAFRLGFWYGNQPNIVGQILSDFLINFLIHNNLLKKEGEIRIALPSRFS